LIKNILHKLFFLLIIINIFTLNSFANECENQCLIKNWPANVLGEYINNNRKVINNINSKIIAWSNTNYSSNKKIWLQVYNSLFNWSEVESWFKYFVANIDWDVPKQISRDLMIIDNQNRALNRLLEKILSTWNYSEIIDWESKLKWSDVCNWISDTKCETILNWDLSEILKKLIRNNSKIALILRRELGFMWVDIWIWSTDYQSLFLVPLNFREEIKKNYNKSTSFACSKCIWWTADRISKAIEKITLNDQASKEWINQWKKAWDRLLWVTNQNDEIIRENIEINKNLKKEWINTNSWEANLKTNKNSSNNNLSLENNPITNSFRTFTQQYITPIWDIAYNSFSKTVSSFENIWDSFSIENTKEVKEKLQSDYNINKRIDLLIKSNEALINRQNIDSDKLQSRIIKMHINLSQTINKLEKITPKSEKVCNDQDNWNGKCSYR
jgi:hypothetical protein